MPPNSQQRAIFVYLRSKDDHKSCIPAGAKLTDEYTPRTNKNNPSTISVTPPQLCTFFRKRTLDFDQSTAFFVGNSSFIPRKLLFHTVWNFSFTQVVLIVSSFLQNDLPDAPLKSFHWTAITIYNASALKERWRRTLFCRAGLNTTSPRQRDLCRGLVL